MGKKNWETERGGKDEKCTWLSEKNETERIRVASVMPRRGG